MVNRDEMMKDVESKFWAVREKALHISLAKDVDEHDKFVNEFDAELDEVKKAMIILINSCFNHNETKD